MIQLYHWDTYWVSKNVFFLIRDIDGPKGSFSTHVAADAAADAAADPAADAST